MIELYDHQIEAIPKLKTGSILCGGVGSGKSRTALTYYYCKECDGQLNINGEGSDEPMANPKDLYIITTARKRDSMDWEKEAGPFLLFSDRENSVNGVKLTVDSWNNIKKYADINNAFFIFDEQRVVGNGVWVKTFLKITKSNNWILLSATPGDTWSDYIPVFIANGFYKNRTEFYKTHCVFSRFSKYPKIERYLEHGVLNKHRREILVNMNFVRNTKSHHDHIVCAHNTELYKSTVRTRWDPYKNEPITDMAGLCYVLRKISNSSDDRIRMVENLIIDNPKCIIFYNFDYELEILRDIGKRLGVNTKEWNGHKHEEIPDSDRWIYLCQYTSANEAWNCITTNVIIFYSQNYSYKVMHQASGRIDRMNTPYIDLYYYHIRSNSSIDIAIYKALSRKKKFNENAFIGEMENNRYDTEKGKTWKTA